MLDHDNRHSQNVGRLGIRARHHYILLLAERDKSEQLLDRRCQKIENPLFHNTVAREPASSLERCFARWSVALRTVMAEAGLNEFLERNFVPALAERAEAIEFALCQLPEQRIWQYRSLYTLAKHNQGIDRSSWATTLPPDLRYNSIQVEHILPQNSREEAPTPIVNLGV